MPLDLSPRLRDMFTPRLQDVARSALNYFAELYGNARISVDQQIAPDIPWRPTFLVRPNNLEFIGVEVEEIVYPEALRGCAIDLRQGSLPVAAYAVCPLEVAQADKNEKQFKSLCAHGFGFCTVDEEQNLTKKHSAIHQQQFIPEEEFREIVKTLPLAIRRHTRSAYETYQMNPVQGVQEIGQIPEALIWSVVDYSDNKNWLDKKQIPNKVALAIGELLACNHLQNARPSLGAAADFFSNFRNKVSHAPISAKKNAARMKKCRDGFTLGVRTTNNLIEAMKGYGISTRINL